MSKTRECHLSVNISKEDLEVLTRICRDRGESIAAFVRMAALKELARLGAFDELRAKSLGIRSIEVDRKLVNLSTGHVEANKKL
jgi:hypothetical protein